MRNKHLYFVILSVLTLLLIGCSTNSKNEGLVESENILVEQDELIYIDLPESIVGDTKFFTEDEYLKDKEYISSAEKIEGGLRLGITSDNHKMMIDSLKLWLESSFLTLSSQVEVIKDISINEDYNRIDILLSDDDEVIDEVIETLGMMLEYIFYFEGKEIDFQIVALNTSGDTIREVKYPL